MIGSHHAVLDVIGGRTQLRERVENGEEITVMIIGKIVKADKDDGVSTEFIIDVGSVAQIISD